MVLAHQSLGGYLPCGSKSKIRSIEDSGQLLLGNELRGSLALRMQQRWAFPVVCKGFERVTS